MTMTTEQLAERVRADRSLPGLLESRVATQGDDVLLHWAGEDITYAAMDARANAIANGLAATGIERGDRVAVMAQNSAEWVSCWLGAAKLGAITVTINTAHKGDGLAYLLRHSQSKVLITDPESAGSIAAIASDLDLPTVFVTESHDSVGIAGARPFEELSTAPPDAPPSLDLTTSDPCSILYTSGTTGPPKGCLLPHGQYVAAAHLHADNCAYDRETVLYTCLPLFHINAQNYSLLSAMAAGGTLALDTKFSATRFWKRVVDTGATAFNFIGAMAVSLWNLEPSEAEKSHRAKIAFGVPIPPPIWEQWEQRFRVHVIYAYGMTENALPAIYPREDLPAKPHLRGAAGKESPSTEVIIVDDNDDRVAHGTIGEILTRPKIPFTMMLEYVDRQDATIEAFRNCWFHTGDLGYLDEEGHLFYVDRKKDALRRRGEMVSSWEVEGLVAKFPGVAECACVGVPSEMTEDDILVAVVTEDGQPVDAAGLIEFCRERTAHFQVPRYVRTVPELPRTQTQRVEKYRLREAGVTDDSFDAQAAATAS